MPTSDSRSVLAAVRDPLPDDRGQASSAALGAGTPIYIVASPRQQVGKTFLARVLADFLGHSSGTDAQVFEVDPGPDALTDHQPERAIAASVSDIRGEMLLFDHLVCDDGVPKVVDLGSIAYNRFFAIVQDIGFVPECHRRGIEPAILFAADESEHSIAAFGKLQQRFRSVPVVPVFNEMIARGRHFQHRYRFDRAAAIPVRVPVLASALKFLVDRSHLTFAHFHGELPAHLATGPVLELRSWTRRTFLEFRELELRLLLEKLRRALPGVELAY